MARSIGASLLLNRFGFGARAEGGLSSEGEARQALLAEIDPRLVQIKADAELLSSVAALSQFDEFRTEAQKKRAAEQAQAAQQQSMQSPAMQPPAVPPANPGPMPALPLPQRLYRAEVTARLKAACEAPTGFGERWVWFWSNHFCVSVAKGPPLRVLAGAYEREAIRPFVFGSFATLLDQVVHHPAMLMYLDNRQSIGPNSRAGSRRGRGLNENLAREILELHTLGVSGGYTQADVTRFAQALTGWTVIGPNDEDGEIGRFHFNVNRHEPGPQTVLGKVYDEAGEAQGRRILQDIAQHPATARFLATRLARHFLADEAPAAAVRRLEETFVRTKGDLAAMARTLLQLPEALAAPTKLRSPQEFMVAALRALNQPPETQRILGALGLMGHTIWMPAGPNGFPDTTDHWLNPEGMKLRLEVASQLGRMAPGAANPPDVASQLFGDALSGETRMAISRASSRQQGLALVLLAPEFQRR